MIRQSFSIRRHLLIGSFLLTACGDELGNSEQDASLELSDATILDASLQEDATTPSDAQSGPAPGQLGGACLPQTISSPFAGGCDGVLACENSICIEREEGRYLGPCRTSGESCDIGLACVREQCRPKVCDLNTGLASDGSECGAWRSTLSGTTMNDLPNIPPLYEISGHFIPCNNGAPTPNVMPNLEVVGRNVSIVGCSAETEIDLPNLRWIGGILEISSNPNLQNAGTWQVEQVDGFIIRFFDNPNLTSLGSFPNLDEYLGILFISTNPQLATLEGFSQLEHLKRLFLGSMEALENLNGLSGLERLDTEFLLDDMPNLSDVSQLLNVTTGQILSIGIGNAPRLPRCRIEELAEAWGVPTDNPKLYEVEAVDEESSCD